MSCGGGEQRCFSVGVLAGYIGKTAQVRPANVAGCIHMHVNGLSVFFDAWCVGPLVFWIHGVLALWYFGCLALWYVVCVYWGFCHLDCGICGFWYFGFLLFWISGMLGRW